MFRLYGCQHQVNRTLSDESGASAKNTHRNGPVNGAFTVYADKLQWSVQDKVNQIHPVCIQEVTGLHYLHKYVDLHWTARNHGPHIGVPLSLFGQ